MVTDLGVVLDNQLSMGPQVFAVIRPCIPDASATRRPAIYDTGRFDITGARVHTLSVGLLQRSVGRSSWQSDETAAVCTKYRSSYIVSASRCRDHVIPVLRNGFRCGGGSFSRPYSTCVEIHRISKNCAKLFLPELCQISTNFDNFWQKDGEEAKIMQGAIIFHLT